MEFGEKNFKYFLNLQKWHRGRKSTKSLRNGQGVRMQNQEKILSELVTYCQYLYSDNQTSDEENCYDFITSTKLPRILKEESEEYDLSITSKKCFTVLFQLSNKKSPCLDRFLLNFIKPFGNILPIFFRKT